MIFQEPGTSLNPVMRIGEQIREPIERHTALRGADARARAVQWLGRVGIPEPEARIDDYPFQFSGGQKQRIMIALALAAEPDLLIADEPTTALDVTIQAQILQLIRELQKEMDMGVIFITHDMGVVAEVANRVMVMRYGEVVEEKISLSERFGLWISFYPPKQDEYLDIVAHWLKDFGLSPEKIAAAKPEALIWALERGSRSGRVAWQFARHWAGQQD
jgi:ABC-type polar amino acid transport system ATPase subunit